MTGLKFGKAKGAPGKKMEEKISLLLGKNPGGLKKDIRKKNQIQE